MIRADLSGKRALVTGGASGMGLATAAALIACGARVAINFLADDLRGPEEAERIGATVAPGTVADPDDAARMVRSAIETLGGLDILINNAGTPGTDGPIAYGDLDGLSEEIWDRILQTNLMGAYRCAKAAAAALRASRGCIVNTTSIAGLGGPASTMAYAASKAALINLTRSLAKGLAPEVRVNSVAPGLTRTPWTDVWPEERKARTIATTMLNRMVEASDIADTMVFLCAQQAITGQTIAVDAGRMF